MSKRKRPESGHFLDENLKFQRNFVDLFFSQKPALRVENAQRIPIPSNDDGYWGFNMYHIPQFLSDAEVQEIGLLIQHNKAEFERSMTGRGGSGTVSEERTSESLIFPRHKHQALQRVSQKVLESLSLTMIEEHIEPLQIVTYTDGQEFQEHHDAADYKGAGEIYRLIDPIRAVTIFIYLNNLSPEEKQGATIFPRISQRFVPKRGSAVIWPNIRPRDISEKAIYKSVGFWKRPLMLKEAIHAAEPVSVGRKFGLNVWITVCATRYDKKSGNKTKEPPKGLKLDPADSWSQCFLF